jgi:hypothetical protein
VKEKLERRQKKKENMHARDKPKLNPPEQIDVDMRTVLYLIHTHKEKE